MQNLTYISFLLVATTMVLAACQTVDVAGADQRPENIRYLGVQTKLLADDLVQFHVTLTGTENPERVEAYAECAAAQYTLIRGFGFARHIRTTVGQTAERWNADAVYTISAAIRRGTRTLDAEVVADNCALNGIPMV
jgi:predicted small secreted protein